MGSVSCVHPPVSAPEVFQGTPAWQPWDGPIYISWGSWMAFVLSHSATTVRIKEEPGHSREPKPSFAMYLWRLGMPGWYSGHTHCVDSSSCLASCIQWSKRWKVPRNTIFTILCLCVMLTNAVPHQGSTHQSVDFSFFDLERLSSFFRFQLALNECWQLDFAKTDAQILILLSLFYPALHRVISVRLFLGCGLKKL